MAYTTINKSSEHFNTKLYTGNNSTNVISGVGFQPDWFWIKDRSTTGEDHHLFDAVRGLNKALYSNQTSAETTGFDGGTQNNITAVGNDGFTITGNGSNGEGNLTGRNYVAWNWKANGAGSANTDGDINSTVSANTTAGFSIVKYTGNGSNDQTVGHGLGARPTAWFIKRLGSADDWIVYHQGLGATQSADWYDDTYMYLNSSSAKMGSIHAGTGNPTSSVFYIGSSGRTGVNGDDYIAYVFAEKTGYSKFGSYTGNGSTDGTFVYTGFKPAFLIIKRTNSGANWIVRDNKRDSYNYTYKTLEANGTTAEADDSNYNRVDFISNGFKLRGGSSGSGTDTNGSGDTYIYMAFAEAPLVGTNNIPCTAR